MLVDFERAQHREDEDGIPVPLVASVNPNFVGSVLDHAHQRGMAVIRMCDGRGLLVRGTAAQVVAKIKAATDDKGKKAKNEPLVLPAPVANASEVDCGTTAIEDSTSTNAG